MSGFDVAGFVADVDHFPGMEGVGSRDGAEVLGFALEFAAGGNEVEVVACAVPTQKDFDVFHGVGGEDADLGEMVAQGRELFEDAGAGAEAAHLIAEHEAALLEEDGDLAGFDPEGLHESPEAKLAIGGNVRGFDEGESVVGGEAVVGLSCCFKGISEGAVEVEDDHPIHGVKIARATTATEVHRDDGFVTSARSSEESQEEGRRRVCHCDRRFRPRICNRSPGS